LTGELGESRIARVTSTNPFAPPKTAVELARSSDITAILVGAAVGNGSAYAVLFVLGGVFLWMLTLSGVPSAQLYVRAYQSTGYLLFAHLAGAAACLPGGYWAARLSESRPVRNAIIAGCLVSLLALCAYVVPYELPGPFWSHAASVILPIPAFLLGALWRQRGVGSTGA
jgi:hypothetical protein